MVDRKCHVALDSAPRPKAKAHAGKGSSISEHSPAAAATHPPSSGSPEWVSQNKANIDTRTHILIPKVRLTHTHALTGRYFK